MNVWNSITTLALALAPSVAAADSLLDFPEDAVLAIETKDAGASFEMPIGPFAQGALPTENLEGQVNTEVWRTQTPERTTLALLAPLRQQLEVSGYTVVFECATKTCGGFDFRFGADVMPEPDMHVDLGDFRYLAATRSNEDTSEAVSLFVSRSPERGFIQVTRVGDNLFDEDEVVVSTKSTAADVTNPDLASQLELTGSAVLDGLEFEKGAANLSGDPTETLRSLSEFLVTNPDSSIILVGHTDTSGSLKRNVTLSRQRAISVMGRLIENYGISPNRLSAEGVGYLSPRATNATEAGRQKNRRVEVVLTSTLQ